MANRTGKGYWQKGKSANPKGRPKVVADVKELARKYTTQAISTLAEIMADDESGHARAMAADKLLDRGWGKAPQALTGPGGEGPIIIQMVTGFDADDQG